MDPFYYRLTRSFWRGSHEGSINVDPLEVLDSDSIFRFSERVVSQAAEEGNCVIVGRGSQHFLQDRPDTLRFFFYAPREDKIQRLVAQGTRRRQAEHLVDTVDRERAAFIKTFFHVNWPNRPVYHAMINTSAGEETVIRTMLSFMQAEPAQGAA